MSGRESNAAAWLAVAFVVAGLWASELCEAASSNRLASILLWPNGAPGSEGRTDAENVRLTERGEHIVSNVHAPSIVPILPARGKTLRPSVILIPGGGHAELWMDHEGYNVASFLAAHGVAAFVLKYRLARAPGSSYTVEGDSLADVQRAIRLVRSRTAGWGLDPRRLGVMGFSAGGELAVLAATRYDAGAADAVDLVERQSSRPDFEALLYPAIPRNVELSKDTPPAFLLAGAADQSAISEGLASLYLDLRRAGVRAELHLYDGVGHGFGIRAENTGGISHWPDRFMEWLEARVTPEH